MFRALSAYLQEDTVVHIQHMVLSLSMRVLGVLSVHSLSEFSLKLWDFSVHNVHKKYRKEGKVKTVDFTFFLDVFW